MPKPSEFARFLLALLILAAIGGLLLLRLGAHRGGSRAPPAAPGAVACDPPAWRPAAAANRRSLTELAWAPFGQAETGWATYAPLVAQEIGTPCPPESAGFAERYARWQTRQNRAADGIFKPEEFDPLRDALALRRPFVQLTARGRCPAAPDEASLAAARPDEGYRGKVVRLRPGTLAAYRRMVAAARRDGVALQPPALQLISGFRGPAEEAAGCADRACSGPGRARCSAHRTGLALDLYLEPAPGAEPTSSAEANRRRLSQTPEYRWLAAHARAFGFLPYAYEPWHWEWTGEPP